MDPQRAPLIALVLACLGAPALALGVPQTVPDLAPVTPKKLTRGVAPAPFTPGSQTTEAPTGQCMAQSRSALIAFFLAYISTPAQAQEGPQVVRDLDPMTPRKLTKEDLQQLLPGAKMSRLSASGNTHLWTNDPDGTFIVSSDNRNLPGGGGATGARGSTAPGKWHISDDGRYCLLIEWKSVPTEEWCRYFFVVADGSYYATKSARNPAEKVYKLQVSK